LAGRVYVWVGAVAGRVVVVEASVLCGAVAGCAWAVVGAVYLSVSVCVESDVDLPLGATVVGRESCWIVNAMCCRAQAELPLSRAER
jgi:hypothetical protein